MTSPPFDEQAQAARSWWDQLQPRKLNGRTVPGDRAALAKLRRVSSVLEAAAEPATAALYKKLGFTRPDRDLSRAALLAAVLAHVRDGRPEPVARAIGTPRSGESSTALVTPLRLKRLIAARTPDDLLIAFRRVVAILDCTANVKDLARQLLAWTDENLGDIARTRFTFDYHGAGQYAPDAPSNNTEKD